MVELRTYKTGLRVPSSLRSGITSLVLERQVLRFLEKHGDAGFDVFLKETSSLSNAPQDVKDMYGPLYARWNGCSKREIKKRLSGNLRELQGLKGADPRFIKAFTAKDIKPASGTATPDPEHISRHDYCRLAGESFKATCATVNTIAMEAVDALPGEWEDVVSGAVENAGRNGKGIKEGSLRKYPEKAIAHFLGRHGNVELTAFEQAAGMLQVHEDMRGKVDEARELLFSPDHDFYNAEKTLLYTCSVPKAFLYYLSSKWNVDIRWVRNTLVGWRRKIDPLLPVKCQAEPFVETFSSLADHAKGFVEGEDQIKVVGILERKRLLHLLPREAGVDLSPLLDAKLHGAYQALREDIQRWPGSLEAAVELHATSFSKEILVASAETLARSCEELLTSCEPGSRQAEITGWFLKNVEFIKKHVNDKTLPLFKHYLPGTKYTGSVAKLLPSMKGVKENGRTNLFTALRGIAALAFASLHANVTANLERTLVPSNCVTRPYMSSKRKKVHLPVNLLFNKYVVERKAHPGDKKYLNNKEATEILKQGKPAWLGIFIYSPDQFDSSRQKLSGSRKGIFWFQLVPTKPIIKRLQEGAMLESIRLNVPRGPTRKIVADLTLSADDPAVFARSSKFIDAMDREFGKKHFPKDNYISNDFNKLGEHAIAVGTPSGRISLVDSGNVMKSIKKKADRIGRIYENIGSILKALEMNAVDPGKRGRQEAQVTLLHQRIARLHAQAEREIIMVYLYSIYRVGATHVGWDSVTVDTRGKRGVLAKAITFMPKKKGLMAEFEAWVLDLKAAGKLPRFEKVVPMSPYTSQACDECFARTGKQAKTRSKDTKYHEFRCTTPGCPNHDTVENRHEISARVSAILLQKHVENAVAAGT